MSKVPGDNWKEEKSVFVTEQASKQTCMILQEDSFNCVYAASTTFMCLLSLTDYWSGSQQALTLVILRATPAQVDKQHCKRFMKLQYQLAPSPTLVCLVCSTSNDCKKLNMEDKPFFLNDFLCKNRPPLKNKTKHMSKNATKIFCLTIISK